MCGKAYLCACALLVFSSLAWASDVTQFSYSASSLGGTRWQYDYTVSNISLSPSVKEVTVRFDAASCRNLAVVTPAPAGWDAIVIQPEPFLNDPGAYDALHSGAGILPGNVVSGFSVRFDWLGTGSPAAQWYEVVNPITFATIDSGWTVPEPATLLILGLGSLAAVRRARRA